jgi:hypothetical protein
MQYGEDNEWNEGDDARVDSAGFVEKAPNLRCDGHPVTRYPYRR